VAVLGLPVGSEPKTPVDPSPGTVKPGGVGVIGVIGVGGLGGLTNIGGGGGLTLHL